jgi:hypothetical protein
MTNNPDEVTVAAGRRADLIAGLNGLAAWLTVHPDTPLPVVHANFRVPAGERGEQLGFLDELAELLGTEVADDGMGTLVAMRRFGPLRAEGHVSPEDRSVGAYLDRAAARRAAQAGNGAAA